MTREVKVRVDVANIDEVTAAIASRDARIATLEAAIRRVLPLLLTGSPIDHILRDALEPSDGSGS